jgi:hypothetical protein
MARSREPAAPPVTVTVPGGPADAPVADGPRAPRSGGAALALAVLAIVAVGVALADREPPPPPPPPLDADLRLVEGGIGNSQSGVLVVPVEVVNRGPAVEVARTVVRAEPVQQESTSGGVARVDAGGTGRIVAVIQPHCAVVAPRPGIAFPFAATLVVTLRGPQQQEADLRLDLGQEPAVAARVASLCRPPS